MQTATVLDSTVEVLPDRQRNVTLGKVLSISEIAFSHCKTGIKKKNLPHTL